MSLPKIDQPLFELTIPSTNQKIKFRPFTVKEEKLLLIAQQSNDDIEMIRAMMQVVNNCVQESSFDIEKHATFDLEYMFIKIRARSVNNIIKVSYKDKEDGEIYNFEINADELEIKLPADLKNKVKIDDTRGMTLKYPAANIINAASDFKDNVELMMFFIVNCIDTIYDSENVYNTIDFSYEEKLEFVEQLPVAAFDDIKNFFDQMPKLYHELNYTNKMEHPRKIVMDNIRDFFIWG